MRLLDERLVQAALLIDHVLRQILRQLRLRSELGKRRLQALWALVLQKSAEMGRLHGPRPAARKQGETLVGKSVGQARDLLIGE